MNESTLFSVRLTPGPQNSWLAIVRRRPPIRRGGWRPALIRCAALHTVVWKSVAVLARRTAAPRGAPRLSTATNDPTIEPAYSGAARGRDRPHRVVVVAAPAAYRTVWRPVGLRSCESSGTVTAALTALLCARRNSYPVRGHANVRFLLTGSPAIISRSSPDSSNLR